MRDRPKEFDIINIVAAFVKKNQKILIAFSGGLDSTVLLHVLVELRKQYALALRAIHVNHGLNKQANNWQKQCQRICQQWHIPFKTARVHIDKHNNIEARARQARYGAIASNLAVNEVVMTAQHRDDQSETFLLALKRGSGPMGLSAMSSISAFSNSELIRPLLSVSRQAIHHYATHHQLSWIQDETNQDQRYDRNFLRINVLPLLKQRWPHFDRMIERSATLCAEQTMLVEELLSEELATHTDEHGNLLTTPLFKMSDVKRNALLRSWLRQRGVTMPSKHRLRLLWQTVARAREDANPQFSIHPYVITRYQKRLYVLVETDSFADTILSWNMKKPLLLPNTLGKLHCNQTVNGSIRKATPHESVTIRFKANGKFLITRLRHSKNIKKIWQELGVPPWMRHRIPLLYYNETLISAVGMFVTREGEGNQLSISLEPI